MSGNAQPIRRMKTYTGGQGYVYQYYFVGKRQTSSAGPSSTEYIFDVTSDRKTMFAVSVFLFDSAVTAWGSAHGRALTDAERYAAAKMRLFQAFDQIEDMLANGRRLDIEPSMIQELLADLGIQ